MTSTARVPDRTLRSFGLLVGGIFSVVGVWPAVIRGHQVRWWAVLLGLALVAAGILTPRLLRWPYRVWMRIGETLGWFNSRVILTVMFYAFFTPVGAIARWCGYDPLARRFDRQALTYKTKANARAATHLQQQF